MTRPVAWLLLLAVAGAAARAAAPALEPPSPEAVQRGRAIVASMQRSERGPYSRIAWFCADGSVHPPRPYACAERGGGRQHAVYSAEREELARLGWSVGTIFAATEWDELWDAEHRQARMRQLPFERYLIEAQDGWVLRRALEYRGRVQAEDETAAGRELLIRVLGTGAWLRDNYLLVHELARTIPHHGGADRTRSIRRLSQEIAERDPSFEPLRVRIHGTPGAGDAPAVRSWIERRPSLSEPLARQARTLAEELEGLYSPQGRRQRIEAARTGLQRDLGDAEAARSLEELWERSAFERIDRIARVLRLIRDRVETGRDPAAALALLDLVPDLEAELSVAASERLRDPAATRGGLVLVAARLADAAYGAGLLSENERASIESGSVAAAAAPALAPESYLELAGVLERSAGWALGSVRYNFAEPLAQWPALEPGAARFVDELLRGSPMLPLADIAHRLAVDAERSAGRAHRMFGKPRSGLAGLNPGFAVGPLRILGPGSPAPGRDEIVVIAETVSDLPPVAGILTLAEGNLLSHVQLLARNLGIPNATLPPDLGSELVGWAGRPVLLAVGRDGSVVVEDPAAVPAALLGQIHAAEEAPTAVDAPRPDLTLRRPIPLSELHAGLAGRVVGPKAANLGELARLFPGRVAPAVALPFGVFAEHVSAGAGSPRARLDRAFARHRSGEIEASELAAEVETVRTSIAALSISEPLRAALLPMMQREFGDDGTYGVFLRSDTNVEDLPGFTGAGLNLTVPHVVGLEKIVGTIPQVWASPFTGRAMAWRAQLLRRPEEVYSSVLLMRTVPAEKSGVMVTTDLTRRRPGLTVATAWGVGGAVDGEAAEMVVLQPDGMQVPVREAKAPYRRRPRPSGGLEWVPASSGPVLTPDECAQLRDLAREIERAMRPVPGPDGTTLPWDIEFGFEDGKLRLFQIRPLVERGSARGDLVVRALVRRSAVGNAPVEMDRPPEVLPAQPAAKEGGSS